MPDGIRWVGVDVHARESTVAVFDQATGELVTKKTGQPPDQASTATFADYLTPMTC